MHFATLANAPRGTEVYSVRLCVSAQLLNDLARAKLESPRIGDRRSFIRICNLGRKMHRGLAAALETLPSDLYDGLFGSSVASATFPLASAG